MHCNSMNIMKKFFEDYLKDYSEKCLTVVDVGSKIYDVNISYKDIVSYFPNFKYIGIDLDAGDNVDVVLTQSYNWPFNSNTIDVVISGQCAEHVEFLEPWFNEISRILKVDGYLCIIAPNIFPLHNYPKDYWRFTPEKMTILLEQSNLKVIETNIIFYEKNIKSDCYVIGKKTVDILS